jgi:hypothetical protein
MRFATVRQCAQKKAGTVTTMIFVDGARDDEI